MFYYIGNRISNNNIIDIKHGNFSNYNNFKDSINKNNKEITKVFSQNNVIESKDNLTSYNNINYNTFENNNISTINKFETETNQKLNLNNYNPEINSILNMKAKDYNFQSKKSNQITGHSGSQRFENRNTFRELVKKRLKIQFYILTIKKIF